MKTIKYLAVSAALISLIACSKSDLESATGAEAEGEVLTTVGSFASWSSVSNSDKGTDAVAFAGEVRDAAITEDVIENGMVLVFGKANNHVQPLPFQESNGELRYWYYHVTPGSVFIQASAASKTAAVTTAQDFAVVVLTQDQLEKLESAGTSRDLLLGMSLEQVSALVK